MTKNIGISGTPEEIQIIAKLLELEGYKSIYDNINIRSLLTYTDKKFGVYYNEVTHLDKDINTLVFKTSEFDQAYQYLFDTELFSTEYFTNKNVVIHCTNEEEWKSISTLFKIKWFNSTRGWKQYKKSVCVNINSTQYGTIDFYTQRNYTIIPASFVLKFKSENMNTGNKKIIGYKAPMDFYGGNVIKGTIYVKPTNGHNWYIPEKIYKECSTSSGQMIPKEIVEQWEAIYEEQEVILNIGKPLQRVIIDKDGVTCDNKTISFGELQALRSSLAPMLFEKAGWNIYITEIKIGCSTFSIEEFNQVFESSKKFTS
jgi:hypothetical protein